MAFPPRLHRSLSTRAHSPLSIPSQLLRDYLLGDRFVASGCLRTTCTTRGRRNYTATQRVSYMPGSNAFKQAKSEDLSKPFRKQLKDQAQAKRALEGISPLDASLVTASKPENPIIPFRKQLKNEAKARKESSASSLIDRKRVSNEYHPHWELTVGIEIHAQLNTPRKLFSSAASTINADPNQHVAFFDLAIPGTQPIFQPEVLIPAIRAALALNCDIQNTSKFDRKHYFHWDQPQGYQITQYYQPFANNGHIILYKHDGISEEDLSPGEEFLTVEIKQVQMEQDTAKTIAQPDGDHLLDFNRVGLPLIEIITMPQIRSPSTAAALVRKVQTLLSSVDACVLGMESGGLRADVNVSVRRRGEEGLAASYAGVSGLGQRTEIKNLSSFKAVKDAIIAERDRQIAVLESGGAIEGETRGWTIGSTETRRLRGKEGEVDYRYMPDPDIPPVIIGDDLVDKLQRTMGVLPDSEIENLTNLYGLTVKDAMSLIAHDDGGRAEYFYNIVEHLQGSSSFKTSELGRIAGNWVLHELGGLAVDTLDQNTLQFDSEGNCIIPAQKLAAIINYLLQNKITGKTAKLLLSQLLQDSIAGHGKEVTTMIEEGGLWFSPLSKEEYHTLAKSIMEEKVVDQILKGQKGKIMYLVGQMMRNGEKGRVEAQVAEQVIKEILDIV